MPSDTITLQKITTIYNQLAKTNANSALVCAKLLKEKSLEQKNKLFIAKANLILGKAYNNASDFVNASLYLGEAKKIAEELNNKKLLFLVYNTIGTLYGFTDLHDKALENFKRAYALGIELKMGIQNANVLNNIGSVIYQTSNLETAKVKKAKGYILNAIEILKSNNEEEDIRYRRWSIKKIWLDIYMSNEKSIHFHNKLGFQPQITLYSKDIE